MRKLAIALLTLTLVTGCWETEKEKLKDKAGEVLDGVVEKAKDKAEEEALEGLADKAKEAAEEKLDAIKEKVEDALDDDGN